MRIAILDDHLALAQAIARQFPEHEVVGIFSNSGELQAWLPGQSVDVFLIDSTLPGCDIARLIQVVEKHCKVIVMTMYQDPGTWPGFRRMGAIGTVSKSVPLEEFIREVNRLSKLTKTPPDGDSGTRTREPTSRELEVIIGMGRGLNAKQIAGSCRLGYDRTIEIIADVLRLTDTDGWAAAVLRAVEFGWIEPRIPPVK